MCSCFQLFKEGACRWQVGQVAGQGSAGHRGGAGAGEAISKIFAAEGAAVAVTDINQAEVERVAKEIEAAGGRALALKVDATRSQEVNEHGRKGAGALEHRGYPAERSWRFFSLCSHHGHLGGGVGPGHRAQPQDHVSVLPGGGAHHDGEEEGTHHQHRFRRRHRSQSSRADLSRLCGRQGGSHRVHEGTGARHGPLRRNGERDRAGNDVDAAGEKGARRGEHRKARSPRTR